MPHAILEHVWKILKEEAKCEPQREVRLDQLFEDNREGFARAIAKIEFGLDQRLCNDRYIQEIRARTVEFILWVLEKRFAPDAEFLSPDQYEDLLEVDERVEELVSLACADELASGKYDHDQHARDLLYDKVNRERLLGVYVQSRLGWKAFYDQQAS